MNADRDTRVSWIGANQPLPIHPSGLADLAIMEVECVPKSSQDFGFFNFVLERRLGVLFHAQLSC